MTGQTHEGRRTGAGERLLGGLVDQARELLSAAGDRALSATADWADGATRRLSEYAERGGGPGLAAAVAGAKQAASGKSPTSAALHAGMAGVKQRIGRALGAKAGRSGRHKLKVTNIVEAIDVGVPARVAYNQWTQFEDFPNFTKKVEDVERTGDDKLTWKAQIFWSHRTWESTIVEQVPDRRIVWRSTGDKGSVDGSVTFHEIAPALTRILLVLEYHPQGLFERTGNIWRAQGRRARLELKHFARHVATQTALHPDEVEGWRGEIRDGRVVRDHESGASRERVRTARDRDGQEERREDRRAGGAPDGERTDRDGAGGRRDGERADSGQAASGAARPHGGPRRGAAQQRTSMPDRAAESGREPARRTTATQDRNRRRDQ